MHRTRQGGQNPGRGIRDVSGSGILFGILSISSQVPGFFDVSVHG